MIKNPKILAGFEEERLKKDKIPFRKALKLFESMWKEAKSLKVFPLKNPLEGIKTDIRIAKILNSCLKKS